MSRPEFYFCICPDSGLIKQHVQFLMEKFPAKAENSNSSSMSLMGGLNAESNLSWQRHVFWGDEELPSAFWNYLMLQGLFSNPSLLLIRNAQNINAQTWKEISSALTQHNKLTWPIFCFEVPFEKKGPKIAAHLLKQKPYIFAQKKGWFWQQSGLDLNGIKTYILNKAPKLGLTIAPQVLNSLCASVPADATAIDSELEKLRLAAYNVNKAENGQVHVEMIGSGSYIPESNIFVFMNHIYAGNLPAAWAEIYKNQNDDDALLFPFLSFLSRDAKTLWQMLAAESVNLPPRAVQEKRISAQRLGFSGVTKLFDYIVQAEFAIKSGEKTARQTLEILVTQLATLFSRTKRAFPY